ncbi:enoyl-CoA hydratase/isomerase family protein [Nocardia sp. NBC_00565]|uniref:enoyl-CoA hydratase/isomerase family protein n=1 Tax=Nocardia sp. NBC_00565 TaxID=2975993 RepID=UPI002E81E08C|nr:enoyl-CoA hydratase/isomerase family protein [Nocardia sp. NBC_00565]WUC05605.1 enoyl-CoA hydratase/isomerase family protein [Nocardia sp. NBC_00565]
MTDAEGVAAQPLSAVCVEIDGSVAVVTLSRPEKANAMDGEMTYALLAAIRSLRDMRDVHAIVLTGTGTAFSAGGDVETIRTMRDDPAVRAAVLNAHKELFWAMTNLPIPAIAAVNGAAVGAGVTIALLCDMIVMAEEAFLRDPRVPLGLLDGAGGYVLWPLLTSLSAAKEHLLLGTKVTGREAHRLGLANRVVPASEVVGESLHLARRLAELPPGAVRQSRRLLNSHIERAATILDDCAQAEFECFDSKEHHALLEELIIRVAAPTEKKS